MPVSPHAITVTYITKTWKIALTGYDLGELTARCINYIVPRVPEIDGDIRIRIATIRDGSDFHIRTAVEAAIARKRRELMQVAA